MRDRYTLLAVLLGLALTSCDSGAPDLGGDEFADASLAANSTTGGPVLEGTASVISNSAVNASDSYVRGTLVVDFDATVTSDQAMYDAVTGTTSTTMTIDTPAERYDFEMGYDTQGLFVYDQVAQSAPTGPDDGVRRVRVRGGRFQVLDAQGLPVTEGALLPTLESVFQGAIPTALLDGIAIPTLPAAGSTSTSNGSTLSVSSVTTSGSTSIVSSLARSSDPAIPDLPQKRTYVKSGNDQVLTQIQTDITTTTAGVQMNGRMTGPVRKHDVVQKRPEGCCPSLEFGPKPVGCFVVRDDHAERAASGL